MKKETKKIVGVLTLFAIIGLLIYFAATPDQACTNTYPNEWLADLFIYILFFGTTTLCLEAIFP